jgi:NitT/TauT family transport system permease protein
VKNSLVPLIFWLLFLAFWQIATSAQVIPDYLLPSPLQIFLVFKTEYLDLTQALLSTASNAILGLFFSLVFSIVLSVLIFLNKTLSRCIFPVAVFFQTVPVIAIAPLLVIWFGFGAPTVRAAAGLVSFFPILASLLSGYNQVSQNYLHLFANYQSSNWKTFLYLRAPIAIPSFFSGFKIAAGLSVVGAIVGEFVAGGGLGSLIDAARTQQRVDIVFAAILLSTMLGLLFIISINFIEALTKKRWRFL